MASSYLQVRAFGDPGKASERPKPEASVAPGRGFNPPPT